MKRLLCAAGPALSLILLLQVMLAPLHCLAMVMATAGGFKTVLCAPDGVRVIHVDAEGRQLPADDGQGGLCVVCAGIARAVPAEPPRLAAPIGFVEGPAWFAAAGAALPPPARGPPYSPRGPPPHA